MRRLHELSPRSLFTTLLALASACSSTADPGETGFAGAGTPWGSTEESTGAATGESGESTETGESGDEGVIGLGPDDDGFGDPGTRFDVSGWSDIPPILEGCQKVDFLFVIDDSGSMSNHQANLIANYPAFIDGIQDSLNTVDDFHVGVITTDEYAYATPNCKGELSGLVSKTDKGSCGPFVEGHNYMTQADDLDQAFACAADVGVDGDWIELPMAATLQAVQGVAAGKGECNEGFLRDDSLLVVVILTDEADGNSPHVDPEAAVDPSHTSPGLPHQWFDYLVTQRGGIESNVVVLSFLNTLGGPCPPVWPQDDGENIRLFTEEFTYGFVAGICEADYGPHFEQAVDVIADACNTYVNPG